MACMLWPRSRRGMVKSIGCLDDLVGALDHVLPGGINLGLAFSCVIISTGTRLAYSNIGFSPAAVDSLNFAAMWGHVNSIHMLQNSVRSWGKRMPRMPITYRKALQLCKILSQLLVLRIGDI